MEIKRGDYVRYKGKVYSVASESSPVKLISYKDLEILKSIPKSELERLTDFHVSVMRYNKTLPKRRFKVGDRVKIKTDLDSECVYTCRFRDMGFRPNMVYSIRSVENLCKLTVKDCNVHEFEVELV